jgi:hypothetical protein
MLRERSQDGTTGQTGVRDKPKILLRLFPRPGARLAPMTRDFHPGPELLAAPHRGRRYECSLSDPHPALSCSRRSTRGLQGFPRPALSGKEARFPLRLDRRVWEGLVPPGRDCLPDPPADGFLRSQTPPRPPHFHREPEGKARPMSKPPPNILAGLTEESRYEGSGWAEASPLPGPSVAKAPSG